MQYKSKHERTFIFIFGLLIHLSSVLGGPMLVEGGGIFILFVKLNGGVDDALI